MVQDGNRLIVFGSQLVGVLVVVVGLLTQQVELRSPRPIGNKRQATPESGQKGDRFTRLWDDPLNDLATFKVPFSSEGPTPTPWETHPKSDSAHHDPEGIFLWSILDGHPLPEVEERRLRTRYATVSALVTAGYLPLRESSLSPLYLKADGSHPLDEIPIGYFETFKMDKMDKVDKAKYRRVCLIWTAKQSTSVPLGAAYKSSVLAQVARRGDLPADAPLHVLHHGSSDDLEAYLTQKDRTQDSMISFMRATIPASQLSVTAGLTPSLRPILSDDRLVVALVRELSLRIPDLDGKEIVIFTESDTRYGQAITAELNAKKHYNAKLTSYSYLRGLDGRTEDFQVPVKSDSDQAGDPISSLLRGHAISESSLGTSQFDYLRRLAFKFARGNRDIDTGNIRAVGVLGSDIYDKMLVLQAVRPELPDAVFFTTDLDALYLEQQYEDFTRNLVVASAESLYAPSVPPLRDSYQAVLVKYIQEILDLHPKGAEASPAKIPPVFEIVAGRSIPLNDPQGKVKGPRDELMSYVKPLTILVFLLALGNGFGILWAVSTRTALDLRPGSENAPMANGARRFVNTEIVIVGAGIFALFGLLLYHWSNGTPLLWGEPIARGASIWPSVLIRLFAFLIAILLLMNASNSFVGRSQRLKRNLEASVPCKNELPLAEGIGTEVGRVIRGFFSERPRECGEKTFSVVLERFFDHRARSRRIMIASLLYLFLSAFLFAAWPPVVPARGFSAFMIEKVTLSLGVVLYIIHLLYCLDLHLSALTLLRSLRSFYREPVQQRLGPAIFQTKKMLEATSELTSIIGRTLLYPLTVLILIILSRLRIFDNWVMTPSLTITFALGAFLLVSASAILWLEGAKLKQTVLDKRTHDLAAKSASKLSPAEEQKNLQEINDGVFAAWYQQPIFAAILSAAAVFGSVSFVEPLARVFLGSP